jgi:hypothetical protein
MNTQVTDEQELLEVDNSYWSEQKIALEQLKERDFYRTLMSEGYFKNYVYELVMQLVHPNVVENQMRSAIMEKLVGVARTAEYLRTVTNMSTSNDDYKEEGMQEYLRERDLAVKLGQALETAEKDPQFSMVFVDRYGKDFARNQITWLSNDAIIANGKRSEVLEALSGVSTLDNYMIEIRKNAQMAMAEMYEDTEEELEESGEEI